METSHRVNCVNCSTLCSQLPSECQDTDASYEKFFCNRCEIDNFAVKCGYCYSYVVSLLKKNVAPGSIITCENRACQKEFQYLTCPNSACRKPNYRPSFMTMGFATQCDYCKVQFQSVTCDLCYTENYFKGDQASSYKSGVETNCRGCRGTFLQFCCPSCYKPAYADAKKYNPTISIQCDSCKRDFKQTSCPSCKRLNYYLGNSLKFGMVEKCACGTFYKTHICRFCDEIEYNVASLPKFFVPLNFNEYLKPAENICKKCTRTSWQVPCSRCGLACYLDSDPLITESMTAKCINCTMTFPVYTFNCEICNCSYYRSNRMIECPSHPRNTTVPLQVPEHLSSNVCSLLNSNQQNSLIVNNGPLNNLQLSYDLSLNNQQVIERLRVTSSNNGGLLSGSRDPSLSNAGLISPLGLISNNSQVPFSDPSSSIFNILQAPSLSNNRSNLFNNAPSRPSGGFNSISSGGIFSNLQAQYSNNSGSLLNNSNNVLNRSFGSPFSNLQAALINRPPTDDLTQKINDIKESDDTPTDNEEKRCSVCLENEKKVVYIPCGHFACCLACTKIIMKKDKACPICKQKITSFQRIFST